MGRPLGELVGTARRGEVGRLLGAAREGRTVCDHEATVQRPDGTTAEVSLTVSPVLGPAGTVDGASTLARDVGERHRTQRALEHQAMHDALTGLPNRSLLLDRLEQALRAGSRDGSVVAVLFLDLDQFKMVNDAHGHHAGDALLLDVAARLAAVLRSDETLARFGGDEFVLVCGHTDADEAALVAQRLAAALAAPFVLPGGQRLYVTASVGIAVSPPEAAEALLQQADAAMYEAKAHGRGRARTYGATTGARTAGRLSLAVDLREDLAADRLEVHYQPVVCLRTGAVRGVEALARWPHAERGLVPPDVFVRLAEETGLITDLDRWVLGRACRDGARLFGLGVLPPDGHVAVNVSAHDLGEPTLAPMVRGALDACGAEMTHARLVLEVTETVVADDLEHAAKVLCDLRDRGVGIAIDDFGTGYSSLAYLRRFPASVIKIDRSFVRGLADSADDLAIITAVVQLAWAIGMTTVAEGVETLEQCALLQTAGCDAAQGWLWSPALPLAGLEETLSRLPAGRFPLALAPGTTGAAGS